MSPALTVNGWAKTWAYLAELNRGEERGEALPHPDRVHVERDEIAAGRASDGTVVSETLVRILAVLDC